MELESVTLKLPRDLLAGAQRVASAREVTIGHMVRQLLKREVARQMSDARTDATDHRLISTLQALLARDMAEAKDWPDLAERLRPHGCDMRRVGEDVALYKSSCDTRVCAGSALGFPYSDLVARFGAELPDHISIEPRMGVMPAGSIDPTRHAMLKAHFCAARSWPDLINRLACDGTELRLLGAALGIYAAGTGRHLCNSDQLGAGYDTLVGRFGGRHPSDHAGTVMRSRVLTAQE
jgi:hypothetical protein